MDNWKGKKIRGFRRWTRENRAAHFTAIKGSMCNQGRERWREEIVIFTSCFFPSNNILISLSLFLETFSLVLSFFFHVPLCSCVVSIYRETPDWPTLVGIVITINIFYSPSHHSIFLFLPFSCLMPLLFNFPIIWFFERRTWNPN